MNMLNGLLPAGAVSSVNEVFGGAAFAVSLPLAQRHDERLIPLVVALSAFPPPGQPQGVV